MADRLVDALVVFDEAAGAAAGGINADNCQFYIENGASHVIVTSYVFRDGQIDFERLDRLKALIGKEHLVLDLSCRKRAEDGKFYVMTDRWQKFTTTAIEYGCCALNLVCGSL